jgi:hypothetical protein
MVTLIRRAYIYYGLGAGKPKGLNITVKIG